MRHYWTYGGAEYPFDISDADCMKSVGDALTDMHKKADELESRSSAEAPAYERVRGECKMVRGFFDTVFGEGAAVRICGERDSLERHTGAYLDFLSFIADEAESFSKMREDIEREYASRLGAMAGTENELPR